MDKDIQFIVNIHKTAVVHGILKAQYFVNSTTLQSTHTAETIGECIIRAIFGLSKLLRFQLVESHLRGLVVEHSPQVWKFGG